VEEDLGEDRLDRDSKLLEGLHSRRDQYIHSVRGVSSDTLAIALRCRGDVIFIEERGIDGESAHISAKAVTIVGTRVTGGRIVLVELSRESMARGLRFKASSNQLQSIVLSGLPSQGQVLLVGGLEIKGEDLGSGISHDLRGCESCT